MKGRKIFNVLLAAAVLAGGYYSVQAEEQDAGRQAALEEDFSPEGRALDERIENLRDKVIQIDFKELKKKVEFIVAEKEREKQRISSRLDKMEKNQEAALPAREAAANPAGPAPAASEGCVSQDKFKSLREESAVLRKEKAALEKTLSNKDAAIENLNQEVRQLRLQQEQAQENLRSAQAGCQRREEELAVLREKEKEIRREFEQALAQKDGLSKSLQEQSADYERENERLRQEMEMVAREKKDLTKERQALEKETADIKDKNVSHRLRLEEIEKKYLAAQEQIAALKKDIAWFNEQWAARDVLAPKNHKFKEKIEAKHDIYRALGYLFSLAGDIGQAVAFYNRALELQPQDKDIYYNLGYIYTQKGKYRQAVEFYKRALSGGPDDGAVYYNLSVLFAKYLKNEEKSNYYYDLFLEYE